MIGIRNIGGYIPERRDDNFAKAHKYALDRAFIEKNWHCGDGKKR